MSTKMEPAATLSPVRADENPPFNIVIAYDTGRSARHAMRLVNALTARFGRDFEIQRDLWSFAVLALPKASWLASRSAANANILIVASEGDGELPGAVRAWLEQWSDETRPGMAALGALLRERSPSIHSASPTLQFLRAMAGRAGQEFFAGEFPASCPDQQPAPHRFSPAQPVLPVPARQSSLVPC